MDYIGDQSGRHLLRLSNLLEAPDYVKSSSVVEEDMKNLPDAVFGRPVAREFPLDDPGHVWLSHGYCKSAGIKDPELQAKIKKAAELFDITKDLEKLDEAFAGLTKQASHNRHYAITIDFGQADPENKSASQRTGEQGFYPIDTSFEVESSAIKLANDKHRIPLELFVDGCRNIVKRAAELKVANNYLPRSILKYGVPRMPDPDAVKMAAAQRVELTGDPFYNEIAEAVLSNPEPTHDYADLWLRTDRQNGVKIGRRDLDPYDLLNCGTTEEAADQFIESWVAIGNAPIPRSKIASVREEDIRKRFGKETADKLTALVKKAGTTNGSELTGDFGVLDEATRTSFVKFLLAA